MGSTLTSADQALLSADLPLAVQVEIASDRYASGRGHVELRVAGPAEAPTILCLHGIGSHSAGYRAQLAGLGDRFRVVAWNAPGYGTSTPLARAEPDVGDYAQILAALLDALQVEQLAVLVGSSWGSVIAMAFAARYPDRLERLVLSAPNTARGHITGDARDGAIAQMIASLDTPNDAAREAVISRLLPADAPSAVRQRVARLRDAVTPAGWAQAVKMLFTVHTPSIVGQIRCPIDMIVGSLDTLAPPPLHAAPLLEAAPSIRLHVFDGHAHMLKLEAPTHFNDVIRDAATAAHPEPTT